MSTVAEAVTIEKGRRGPNERPSLRDAQRQLTRTRIIAAARALFAERPYVVVSADDIAGAAGISRATFYLHFGGKEDVLRTILAEDLDRQEILIRLLANQESPTRAQIEGWVRQMFGGYEHWRASMQLFSLIVSLDPSYMKLLTSMQDRYIEILAERHAAFRLSAEPEEREKRRTRCHILFFELTNLAFHLSWPDCGLDHEAAVADATEMLEKFLAG